MPSDPSPARRPADRFAAGSDLLAAIALALMAVVAFADVAMRIAGRPITGAYEATAVLVALLVYAGLPGVTRRGEHVRAGMFGGWLARHPGVDRALRGLRNAATAALLGLLAWALADYAQRVGAAGDRAPYIELPLAWVAGFGAAMLALAALLALRARDAAGAENS